MNARTRRHTIARLAIVAVVGTAVGVAGAYAVAADDVAPARPAADIQLQRDQVADWARQNDMAGLSPASVSPTVADSELRQIAEWARSEGLSGLSPAFLSTVDD